MWLNISNFFTGMIQNIADTWEFCRNFFTELLNFFIHIFVPTDEQWAEIEKDYSDMGDALSIHIPFVGLFSEELKKAQDTVSAYDFLIIEMPEINFDFGVVKVNSPSKKYLNISQAYEPYRAYVRGFLFLIVVGMAFVYIFKYVLNFGQTQAAQQLISSEKRSGKK